MADLVIVIPRDPSWPRDTRLELWLGAEDAPSLAASTPSGGQLVATVDAWDLGGGQADDRVGLGDGPLGDAGLGDAEHARVTIRHTYIPTRACCLLPVGVRTVDAAGNRSGLLEQLVRIDDAPQGARGLRAVPGSVGEISLTWTRSKDA